MLCDSHRMGSEAPEERATYEDVVKAPAHLIAELIDGELITMPRPATPHAQAATTLGEELGPPFKRGKGGPGGWILLDEPELHLGAEPSILVPDLAGWRRETMGVLPEVPYLTQTPDWACEVLSPTTRAHDRVRKMPIYRREGVGHVWLVDPEDKLLEVYRLDGESYRLAVSFAGDEPIRAEPFDAIALDLGALWAR